MKQRAGLSGTTGKIRAQRRVGAGAKCPAANSRFFKQRAKTINANRRSGANGYLVGGLGRQPDETDCNGADHRRRRRERQEQQRLAGVAFYSLLCERLFGRRPAKVQLLYLADPVAIIAEPTDQASRGLRRKLTAVWAAIERSCEREDFRPRPSKLCDWCAFQTHCPAFGGDPDAARAEAAATAALEATPIDLRSVPVPG